MKALHFLLILGFVFSSAGFGKPINPDTLTPEQKRKILKAKLQSEKLVPQTQPTPAAKPKAVAPVPTPKPKGPTGKPKESSPSPRVPEPKAVVAPSPAKVLSVAPPVVKPPTEKTNQTVVPEKAVRSLPQLNNFHSDFDFNSGAKPQVFGSDGKLKANPPKGAFLGRAPCIDETDCTQEINGVTYRKVQYAFVDDKSSSCKEYRNFYSELLESYFDCGAGDCTAEDTFENLNDIREPIATYFDTHRMLDSKCIQIGTGLVRKDQVSLSSTNPVPTRVREGSTDTSKSVSAPEGKPKCCPFSYSQVPAKIPTTKVTIEQDVKRCSPRRDAEVVVQPKGGGCKVSFRCPKPEALLDSGKKLSDVLMKAQVQYADCIQTLQKYFLSCSPNAMAQAKDTAGRYKIAVDNLLRASKEVNQECRNEEKPECGYLGPVTPRRAACIIMVENPQVIPGMAEESLACSRTSSGSDWDPHFDSTGLGQVRDIAIKDLYPDSKGNTPEEKSRRKREIDKVAQSDYLQAKLIFRYLGIVVRNNRVQKLPASQQAEKMIKGYHGNTQAQNEIYFKKVSRCLACVDRHAGGLRDSISDDQAEQAIDCFHNRK